MQFNSVLILLFFLVTFVQPLHGQGCYCAGCLDRVTVSAGSKYRIYLSAPCPAGKAAVVSELNVESTDGSSFAIYTKDDPSDTTYYSHASTTSSVTCFDMGDGWLVGGQKSQIYVVIICNNWFEPCPLRYSINIVCTPVKTSSTPTPTSVSTAKTVSFTTLTSVSTAKTVYPSTPTSMFTSTVHTISPSTAELTSTSTDNTIRPSTPGSGTCVCRCCRNGYSSIIVGGISIVDVERCRPSSVPGTVIKMSTTCTIPSCQQLCIDQVASCVDAATLIPGSESAYKVEIEATCRGHSVMVGRVILVLLSVFVSSAAWFKN